MIPAFDQDVEPDGYAWWYMDAVSDDGRHGITLIAFIGSVFSPYYAWARAHGGGDPMAHCAINIALYGPRGRWCMTERDRSAVARDRDRLRVGPSRLRWDGEALDIELDEWAAPLPHRVRGRVRVHPEVFDGDAVTLDPAGLHRWTPVSPSARVEVALSEPGLRWSGTGYLDHNAGAEPLENCFDDWFWSRAATERGPVVLYETRLRDGRHKSLTLHFDRRGRRHEIAPPEIVNLPPTRWRMERRTRSEDGIADVEATWEDTPFYARSLVTTRLLGQRTTAVHESLSLRRFTSVWVQTMLPFRMPRR